MPNLKFCTYSQSENKQKRKNYNGLLLFSTETSRQTELEFSNRSSGFTRTICIAGELSRRRIGAAAGRAGLITTCSYDDRVYCIRRGYEAPHRLHYSGPAGGGRAGRGGPAAAASARSADEASRFLSFTLYYN